MPPINLGILAHVDAGKTSLTERLLFESGAITQLGSVDAGTTRTDSMDLERQRGITIRASVTSLRLGETDVNLIDTPGHSDFVAEVERALGVLDAAVLVLSAVEGVQPQTVILWRALRRVGVPTILFVNKIDRRNADPDQVVEQIRDRLSRDELVVHTEIRDAGTAKAAVRRLPLHDDDLLEPIVESDDRLLRRWADGTTIDAAEIVGTLRRRVADCQLFPVTFGSAVTGAGIDELRWILLELLPQPAGGSDDEPSGVVFAINHDARGSRAWVRMWSGDLVVRDRVALAGGKPERVTQIVVPTPYGEEERNQVTAGDIAAIRGLNRAHIGDSFGTPPPRRTPELAPPTLQAAVTPVDPTKRGAMFTGLTTLAQEDPLIGLEVDEADGNATVRIHGEVQKEVIGALLTERFGVEVRFEDTTVACIERVLGRGTATETMGEQDNPYLATIGLDLEPLAGSDEVEFHPGDARGRLPASFITACEEGVRTALQQGPHGWPVRGCRVTMTASGYAPRQSHAHQKFNKAMSSVGADFRNLAPVVLASCLRQSRTQVCEPVEQFDLDVPGDHIGSVISTLGQVGALITDTAENGHYRRLGGLLPSARISELFRTLTNLTGGEAVFTSRMARYTQVSGEPPTRRRLGPDPADRQLWFRKMPR